VGVAFRRNIFLEPDKIISVAFKAAEANVNTYCIPPFRVDFSTFFRFFLSWREQKTSTCDPRSFRHSDFPKIPFLFRTYRNGRSSDVTYVGLLLYNKTNIQIDPQ
jgi:hypothetical protein